MLVLCDHCCIPFITDGITIKCFGGSWCNMGITFCSDHAIYRKQRFYFFLNIFHYGIQIKLQTMIVCLNVFGIYYTSLRWKKWRRKDSAYTFGILEKIMENSQSVEDINHANLKYGLYAMHRTK